MIVESLPSYGTERYYLLSEIEQKTTFCFLDEPDKNSSKTRPFSLSYLIYNYSSNNIESFIHHLNSILEKAQNATEHKDSIIVFADVLIPKNAKWTGDYEDKISSLLELALKASTKEEERNIALVFGVTDDITGTPGLNKANEYLDAIGRSVAKICSDDIYMIGYTRVEFMGFDSTLEPDAGADIFQALCYRYPMDLWMKKSIEYINEKHNKGCTGQKKSWISASNIRSETAYDGVSYGITWLHVVFILVGMMVFLYRVDSAAAHSVER